MTQTIVLPNGTTFGQTTPFYVFPDRADCFGVMGVQWDDATTPRTETPVRLPAR